jgi:hypothetical protein
LSDKAISRALRGQFHVEASLTNQLLSLFFPKCGEINNDASKEDNENTFVEESVPLLGESFVESDGEYEHDRDLESEFDINFPFEIVDVMEFIDNSSRRKLTKEEVIELRDLYHLVNDDVEAEIEQLQSSKAFVLVQEMLKVLKNELCKSSRTAKL